MKSLASEFSILAGVLIFTSTGFSADLFGPIRIGANRSKHVGACPVEVIFTANINYAPGHPAFTYNYHWERSDGGKSPVNVVKVEPRGSNMLVVKYPWSLGAKGQNYNISAKLFVNSGNTHLSETSQTVSITCK